MVAVLIQTAQLVCSDFVCELKAKIWLKAGMLTRPGVSRPRPRPEIKAKVEFNSYGL